MNTINSQLGCHVPDIIVDHPTLGLVAKMQAALLQQIQRKPRCLSLSVSGRSTDGNTLNRGPKNRG